MARESDSGLSRDASSPEPFSPEAEGLERQVGLFRASPRCAARPLHVCSDIVNQTLSPSPEGSSEGGGASGRRERRVVPVIPGRSNREDPSPPKPQRTLRIEGDVRIASGPWELEEKWWLEERTERDYWDIELYDGTLYRVYRDRTNDRWFADGVYD